LRESCKFYIFSVYRGISSLSLTYTTVDSCITYTYRIRATSRLRACSFVSDQFAVFHLADGREQRIDVILRHGLWQVVDDDVRFGDVVAGRCGRIVGRQVTAAIVLQ